MYELFVIYFLSTTFYCTAPRFAKFQISSFTFDWTIKSCSLQKLKPHFLVHLAIKYVGSTHASLCNINFFSISFLIVSTAQNQKATTHPTPFFKLVLLPFHSLFHLSCFNTTPGAIIRRFCFGQYQKHWPIGFLSPGKPIINSNTFGKRYTFLQHGLPFAICSKDMNWEKWYVAILNMR